MFNQNAFVNSVTPAAGSSVCQVSFLIYGKNIPAVFPLAACAALRPEQTCLADGTAAIEHARLIQCRVLFKFHTRGSLTARHKRHFFLGQTFLALQTVVRCVFLKKTLQKIPSRIK